MKNKRNKCPDCDKSSPVGEEIFKEMETILRSNKSTHIKKIALLNCLKDIESGKLEPSEEAKFNCLLQSKLYAELTKNKIEDYGKEKGKSLVIKNTICSRCKEDIELEDKEIKIENSIICKECLQQIVARCYNCRGPVYNSDPIYEITPSGSVEYIFSADQSEKMVQCDGCYQKGLTKQKKKKGLWVQRKGTLGFFSVLLLTIILFGIYPALEDNGIKLFNCGTGKPWVICGILLILSSTIVFILYKVISVEFISRYEIGKVEKRKMKKKVRQK